MKLNQLLAIEKGIKTNSARALTDLHKRSQVEAVYSGRERKYTPKDDEGDRLPNEKQVVQTTARSVLSDLRKALSDLFDTTLTKDKANCEAFADIVVNGQTLMTAVPVSYLLFLEKQLTDIHTFVAKLPVLSSQETWTWDDANGLFRSEATETLRTKKVTKPVVLYEATVNHPAQVKEVSEDVVVGTWQQTLFSGALPATKKEALLERVDDLLKATKVARETANATSVVPQYAAALFNYLLKD